jgi:hypothetical protein
MTTNNISSSSTDKGFSDYKWTTEFLVNQLPFHLETFIDSNLEKKYQKQAKDLIYRIPVYIPVPPFIVYKKDLGDRLKNELADYSEKDRADVLKTAVERIFENINQRYFLQSVKKLLKVELVD